MKKILKFKSIIMIKFVLDICTITDKICFFLTFGVVFDPFGLPYRRF